jgi:hypothetical protein
MHPRRALRKRKTSRLIGCGLAISLLCCRIGNAQTKSENSHVGILAVDVADNSDENGPIPEAVVFLRGLGKREIIPVKIDSNGKFESPLAPGLYDIFVSADGFAPTCKVVSIEPNKITKYSPRLGPDLEHMQQGSSRVGHR